MAGTGFSLSSNSSPSFGFSNPSATSSAPSFGFGASTTSSAPSFGAFSPLFASSSSTTNLFGSSSGAVPVSKPFGGSGSRPTPNLFGSSSCATPTSSRFGSSSSGSGQTPSLFGANSSAAAPSSPSPSPSPFGTSRFGSPAPRSANLFGSGAQTPSPFGSSSAAPTSSGTTTPLFGQGSTPAAGLFAFPGATSTTSASSAPGFSFPTASTSPTPSFSLSAAFSSSTSTTTTSGFSFNKSTTSSVSSSSALYGVSFGNTGLQSSAPLTSSVSKPIAFGTTHSSLFSTISTTTTTTASAPAATSAFSTASSAGSSASTSLTGLAFPASIGVGSAASAASMTSTSAPSSGFTGFGTLSTPASSSGSTSSFSLSLKSSTAAASSAPQSQSTAALPSLAVASTNASNSTSTSTSTSTSAAQISSAIVASSSGTIATTTTVVASSPKLPPEITGRTFEEDMETTESPPVIGEQLVEENRAPLLEPANEPNNPSVEFTSVDANPHSEVNLTTSEDTPNLSASACRTAEDVSEPQTNQPVQSPSITAQQIINIGAGIQVQKGFSNALDDPSLLDERSLSVQIQEIGTFKTVRSGGVSHSALIPASIEPDGVSWNLGLGTILPGEIEKIKDLSPLQLVQSTFKHIELAKHQIAQLGIQNEDGFFAQSITNTKLDNIAAAHRALMVDVESLRAENEKLLKSNAEIATEKESILKEKDDLCLLIKNMENALQTQIEKAKKSQFDAGFAYGYKQRTQEILTYLGHATSPDQEL